MIANRVGSVMLLWTLVTMYCNEDINSSSIAYYVSLVLVFEASIVQLKS